MATAPLKGRVRTGACYSIDPLVVEGIKAWAANHPMRPSLSAVVEGACREFLERNGRWPKQEYVTNKDYFFGQKESGR